MKAAGTDGACPGAGTAAASSWTLTMVRTLAGVTPSLLPTSVQSSHSSTSSERSASASDVMAQLCHARAPVRRAGGPLESGGQSRRP